MEDRVWSQIFMIASTNIYKKVKPLTNPTLPTTLL